MTSDIAAAVVIETVLEALAHEAFHAFLNASTTFGVREVRADRR